MKKLNILFVISCAIILFSACSGNKEEKGNITKKPGVSSFSNDLEATGWMNLVTLTKEVAHSGRFASRIDSAMQYSFGFTEYFKNINDTLPEKVDASLWILFPKTGIKCDLVVSIDSVGKNIFWSGLPLGDSITKANEWKEIKASIALPANIMSTDKISIYVFCNEKKTLYVDDLKITFGKK
jgi:hypothetical protein